jgi:hypothetical protein
MGGIVLVGGRDLKAGMLCGSVLGRRRAAKRQRRVLQAYVCISALQVAALPNRRGSCQACMRPDVLHACAGTATGASPALAPYYSYWEQAVFNALTVMVLRALEALHGLLACDVPLFRVRGGVDGAHRGTCPLCGRDLHVP